MTRQKNYGGIGDIHFHLICNREFKNSYGQLNDRQTLVWLQSLWCSHVGANANNCLHIDPIPSQILSIPSYLVKYFNKGSQRPILSRQYSCSQELSAFKPITLNNLPNLDLISKHDYVTPSGFESTLYYFNTNETLDLYGVDMLDQGYQNNSPIDKRFTEEECLKRAIMKKQRELYPNHVPKQFLAG